MGKWLYGIVANVRDYDIVVNKFNVHFWTNTLGNCYALPYPPKLFR